MRIFFIGILACLWFSSTPAISQESLGYDAALAEKLSADEYGMKKYFLAFLKAGPNRDHDPETAKQLMRGHLDNISRLAETGKLIFAGPFLDDFEVRGIYIFDVPTMEEAIELTETDPAIQAGRLSLEMHPFYGSAALQLVNEWHKKVQKSGF